MGGVVTDCCHPASHMAALTGDLEKTVLMDLVLDAKRKIERTQSLQTMDMFEHVSRVWLERRLPQPRQPSCLAPVHPLQQIVEALEMKGRERDIQQGIDPSVRPSDGFRAGAFDRAQCRQDNGLSTRFVD